MNLRNTGGGEPRKSALVSGAADHNSGQISDISSLKPKTRLPRDNIKVKRFRIEHSPKMSLPHPNLAALGLLPTHIVWTALPLLPWGCVDLHRALKAERPGGEVGVIISSRLHWAPIQRPGCRRSCEAVEAPPKLRRASLPGGFCCFKPSRGSEMLLSSAGLRPVHWGSAA